MYNINYLPSHATIPNICLKIKKPDGSVDRTTVTMCLCCSFGFLAMFSFYALQPIDREKKKDVGPVYAAMDNPRA